MMPRSAEESGHSLNISFMPAACQAKNSEGCDGGVKLVRANSSDGES